MGFLFKNRHPVEKRIHYGLKSKKKDKRGEVKEIMLIIITSIIIEVVKFYFFKKIHFASGYSGWRCVSCLLKVAKS